MSEQIGKKIPDVVIRRLPRYYRQLCALEKEGSVRISSKALGERLQVKASQIRQDLNSFGGFGQQGYGYPVVDLKNHIAEILCLDKNWKIAIVGAGNIGRALSKYGEFKKEGFEVLALFDNNENIVGECVGTLKILHTDTLEEYLKHNHIDILALTVPQSAIDELLTFAEESTNIGAVWNFAPHDLFSSKIVIENIHLTDSLMSLSFHLGQSKDNL